MKSLRLNDPREILRDICDRALVATRDVQPDVARAISFIETMVLHGEIRPDERIVEADICSKLGIGRSPAREAIRILVGEGLLTFAANRGARLRSLTVNDVLYASELASGTARAALREFQRRYSWVDQMAFTVLGEATKQLARPRNNVYDIALGMQRYVIAVAFYTTNPFLFRAVGGVVGVSYNHALQHYVPQNIMVEIVPLYQQMHDCLLNNDPEALSLAEEAFERTHECLWAQSSGV